MPVILSVYGQSLTKTFQDLAKAPWVLLLPAALGMLLQLAGVLLSPLPQVVGGLILTLLGTGAMATGLYAVAELVAGNPLRLNEMTQAFRRYFWPIMNVNFVFWIAQLLLNPMFQNMHNGGAIELGLEAVAAVLFNAYFEVIYQRQTSGGLEALQGAMGFTQEHWVEWLIPNVLFGAASFFLTTPLLMGLTAALGAAGLYLGVAIGASLLMPIMLFRGHLFAALDAGIRRRVPGWKR